MYTFQSRQTIGNFGEALVTRHLAQSGSQVTRATLEQDRQGVDLHCFYCEDCIQLCRGENRAKLEMAAWLGTRGQLEKSSGI